MYVSFIPPPSNSSQSSLTPCGFLVDIILASQGANSQASGALNMDL